MLLLFSIINPSPHLCEPKVGGKAYIASREQNERKEMIYELPASCFLLPASCFLLPASCFLLPASCFLLPASCFLLPASCFLLPASCFLLPASCFLLPASCFLCRYSTRVTLYYSRKREKREEKKISFQFFAEKSLGGRESVYARDRIVAQRGFALVTVLLLASLLLVMLVGLLSMSSEEAERSRMSVEGERSSGLVETALAEVKAKLMDGGEIPYREGVARASMTACPGLLEVRRYDVLPNRGYQVGRKAFMDPNSYFRKPFAREYERGGQGDWQPANPRWIALYSQKWYAPLCEYMTASVSEVGEGSGGVKDRNPDYNPERVFNLNTKDNPFTPGRLYLGGESGKSVGVKSMPLGGEYAVRGREEAYRYRAGESSVERPVYVQWIPVYEDARYGAVKPGGQSNPLVGRYAYWVDVENTKININEVKREWEKTALGELTGVSDAERRRGSYFSQSREKRKDTLRYTVERYLPKSYKLFRDNLRSSDGVALYYRPNYGEARGQDRSGEFYEQRVFGWEKDRLPPIIADSGVVDSWAFSALRPQDRGGGVAWLDRLLERNAAEVNTLAEMHALLDPLVEKRKSMRGQMGLKGFQRMYGQALTLYTGWEEERDPLGRPKIDIAMLQRVGREMLMQGEAPEPQHEGNALEQLLARLEDPEYYEAYYPGAYPSGGEKLSWVDSLKPFAGKVGPWVDRTQEEHEEAYAWAMRDQLLVNLIEYGRPHGNPPYRDRTRGIFGAKSMPYVAEVAVRARNAVWGLWDAYDPSTFPGVGEDPDGHDPEMFPGPYVHEFPYRDDFDEGEAASDARLAQMIYDVFLYDYDKAIEEQRTRACWKSRNDFTKKSGKYYNFDSTRLPGLPNGGMTLFEYLANVSIDVGIGLVNPDPVVSKEEPDDWELSLHYAWWDPIHHDPTGIYKWINFAAKNNNRHSKVNGPFFEATGERELPLTVTISNKQFRPSVLPGRSRRVEQLGYFFGKGRRENEGSALVYLRPTKPNGEKMYLPGLTLSGARQIVSGGGGAGALDPPQYRTLPGAYQPFRIHGWEIRKKGEREPHHVVPWRHPGQLSASREWWRMTVDGDGEGPLPPPNVGVLASTQSIKYGAALGENFRMVDLHSLGHFSQPPLHAILNVGGANTGAGDRAALFGLGSGTGYAKGWEDAHFGERREVATSWFSSQTILEFRKFADSLRKRIPPMVKRDGTFSQPIKIRRWAKMHYERQKPAHAYHFELTRPDDPQYFYHFEEKDAAGQTKEFSDPLAGYLYFPRIILLSMEDRFFDVKVPESSSITGQFNQSVATRNHGYSSTDGSTNSEMILSDLIRFLMLQFKLRGVGLRGDVVDQNTAFAGSAENEEFAEGMALVERLVCIDPVLGHRTGNDDLLIRRNGRAYRGHYYGVNGHPWRRYNYYFHHYDKDNNSPQAEIFGRGNTRPEPDRCLTQYFSDPRRCNGSAQYEPSYPGYNRREVPLHSLTGSVLWNSLLTKGEQRPDLRGELGWSQISEVEEDGVNIWPYGPGMNVNYTYGQESVHDRLNFRYGSFMTHSPRGEPMVSIGELGRVHSGMLQRVLDLDRPPLASGVGVKRLGSPAYGPPLSMLLDLLTPSNFRDEEGNYLSKEKWERGAYRENSPENPRRGVWSVNSQIGHDNYLAMREGSHGLLSNESEDFYAGGLENVAVHPALVPSAVGERKRERRVVDGSEVIDPYLSPLIRFRRGWEQWLGMIAGDYSKHRNMGSGVWNKGEEVKKRGEVYKIAQGVRNYSWYPKGMQKEGQRRVSWIDFEKKGKVKRGRLLTLGKVCRDGLGGHVSADGPAIGGGNRLETGGDVYRLLQHGKANVSLYDVTRYSLFPLAHHISEVGYRGLGKIHTALNPRSATTEAQGGRFGEEELVDEGAGGDGIIGALSQAGFARNAAWVMSANQMSTSANVFTMHIVTQSLRDKGGLSNHSEAEAELRRKNKERKSLISHPQSPAIGYMDEEDAVLGEQWARVVVARVPQMDERGEILTDGDGTPQYDYKILRKHVLENRR